MPSYSSMSGPPAGGGNYTGHAEPRGSAGGPAGSYAVMGNRGGSSMVGHPHHRRPPTPPPAQRSNNAAQRSNAATAAGTNGETAEQPRKMPARPPGILGGGSKNIAPPPDAGNDDNDNSAEKRKSVKFAPTPEKPKRERNIALAKADNDIIRPVNLAADLDGSTSDGKFPAASADGGKRKSGPNMCNIHNREHRWYDCPNNPRGPNYCGVIDSFSSATVLATSSGVGELSMAGGNAGKAAAAAKGGKSNLGGATTAMAASRTSAKPAAAKSSSSHLFNTSASARPIPRKHHPQQLPHPSSLEMTSSTEEGSSPSHSAGGGMTTMTTGGSIPKKRKFQHHPQQQQRQPQQLVQAGTTRVNIGGQWRRHRVQRLAPSGSGAIALQRHKESRLLSKGHKSAFSPMTGGGEEEDEGEMDLGSMGSGCDLGGVDGGDLHSAEGGGEPTGDLQSPEVGKAAESALQDTDDDDEDLFRDSDDEDSNSADGPSRVQQHPLKNIAEPGPNDRLFGRGGPINQHPGNVRYRQLIDDKRRKFKAAKTKDDQERVVREVISEWRALDSPGRFLKQDEHTKLWNDVGDEEAMEKIFQTFGGRKNFRGRGRSKKGQKKKTESRKDLDDSSSDDEEEDSDDVPMGLLHKHQKSKMGAVARSHPQRDDDSDDDSDLFGDKEDDDGKKDDENGEKHGSEDENEVEQNDQGSGDNRSAVLLEADDVLLVEMQNDLIHLVEQTIDINHRWNTKIQERGDALVDELVRASGGGANQQRQEEQQEEQPEVNEPKDDEAVAQPKKRGRGRPRKKKAERAATNNDDEDEADEASAQPTAAAANGDDGATASEKLARSRALAASLESSDPRNGDEGKEKRKRHSNDIEESQEKKKKKQKQGKKQAGPPWTQAERELYLKGIETCGDRWEQIATDFVTTRSPLQIRAYAKLHSNEERVDNDTDDEEEDGGSNNDDDEEEDGSNINGGKGTKYVTAFGCEKCGEDFLTQKEAEEHERSCNGSNNKENSDENTDPGPWYCNFCNKEFTKSFHDAAEHEKICQQQQQQQGHEVDDHGHDSDDESVPAFLTCDKCSMVFTDTVEATEHERSCTITSDDIQSRATKMTDDKDELIRHLIDLVNGRGGKRVHGEEDMIFFRRSGGRFSSSTTRLDNGEQRQDGDNFGGGDNDRAAQSPPNDATEDDDGEERPEEEADMNRVQHLCSTTIDKSTGLPVQKITVMCGTSGVNVMIEILFIFQPYPQ